MILRYNTLEKEREAGTGRGGEEGGGGGGFYEKLGSVAAGGGDRLEVEKYNHFQAFNGRGLQISSSSS